MSDEHLLTLCFFSTCAMFGIIWIIQLLHYPAYRYIDKNLFLSYQRFHQKRISIVVMPLMLMELISSLLYFIHHHHTIFDYLNLLTVISLWAATFLFFMPLHEKLKLGYCLKTVNSLINTNWLRTGIWSLRVSLFFLI